MTHKGTVTKQKEQLLRTKEQLLGRYTKTCFIYKGNAHGWCNSDLKDRCLEPTSFYREGTQRTK